MSNSYQEYKKQLVKELRKRIVAAGGQGVSVRGGRGTAWGWIEIAGPDGGHEFTPEQRRAIATVCGEPPGGNFWVGELRDVGRIVGISPPP